MAASKKSAQRFIRVVDKRGKALPRQKPVPTQLNQQIGVAIHM